MNDEMEEMFDEQDFDQFAAIEAEMEAEMEAVYNDASHARTPLAQQSKSEHNTLPALRQPPIPDLAEKERKVPETAATLKAKPNSSSSHSGVGQKKLTERPKTDFAKLLAEELKSTAVKSDDAAQRRSGGLNRYASSGPVFASSNDTGHPAVLLTRVPQNGTTSIEIALPNAGLFFIPMLPVVPEHSSSLPSDTAGPGLLGQPIEAVLAAASRQGLMEAMHGLKDTISAGNRARRALAAADAAQAEDFETNTSSLNKAAEEEGNSDDDDDVEDMGRASAAGGRAEDGLASRGSSHVFKSSLWVDRYAPRKFGELLSPELINRNVLRWIRMWDARVFGRSAAHAEEPAAIVPKASPAGAYSAFGRDRSAPTTGSSESSYKPAIGGGKAGAGGFKDRDPLYAKFGYGWNPYAKVLLLCGAPGMGKTTLGHIAASQAGYRTVEINASDERTGETIRNRIGTAQSMNTVLGDRRPVCIILDECDGMDASAIAALVRMIKATPSLAPIKVSSWGDHSKGAKKGGDEGDGSGSDEGEGAQQSAGAGSGAGVGAGKRKRTKRRGKGGDGADAGESQPLTRPLICICNDQYAPALRELRPLVQVVEFDRIAPERLFSRLKNICRVESLVATPDALQSLIIATGADIRACLNTLQFIKAQVVGGQKAVAGLGRRRITTEMVVRASVGCKDQTKAVMDVWAAVYTKRPRTSTVMSGSAQIRAAVGSGRTGEAGAYADLFSTLSGYTSEARLLLAGLHEHVPESRVTDPDFSRTCAAMDWLCYGEEMSHRAIATGVLQLGRYVAAAGLGVHWQLASDQRIKLHWPSGDAALRNGVDARRNILASFIQGRASAPTPAGVIAGTVGSASASGGSGGLSMPVLVQDVLSPLLSILSPNLRAVNFSLHNTKERADAASLVQTLLALGLSYAPRMTRTLGRGEVTQRGPDEDAGIGLTPDLDRLITFEGYETWDVPGLRGSELHPILMQMVAGEVKMARLTAAYRERERQEKAAAAKMSPGGAQSAAPAVALPDHVRKQLANSGNELASMLQSAGPGAGTVSAVPVAEVKLSAQLSFLAAAAVRSRDQHLARKRSAIAVTAASVAATASAAAGIVPGPSVAQRAVAVKTTAKSCFVTYRYQEGFTNAVRRPVTLRDFV